MAVDLTQAGRRTAQRRITNNRDGVLPGRRNTEAPGVAVRADMRAAYRGDGGAADLRRVLDEFTGATAAAGRSYVEASAERYRQEAAEGSLDAETGDELDTALEGSLAYQSAFYATRLQRRFTDFADATKVDVETALNRGDEPESIERLVLERIQTFRDAELAVLPRSAGSRAWTESATRIRELGGELETFITGRIRERVQGEFVDDLQATIQSDLAAGREIAFEDRIARLREGGIEPADAKRAALDAILSVALDRDRPQPELLDELLESRREDGTPSLSAAEQLQVQDRITQARALADQIEREAREDRRDELVAAWYPRALGGEIVDDEINAAVAAGDLSPQEGVQMLSMTEGLRDHAANGHADEDFILDVEERIARGSPPSVSQVSAWLAQGRFGTGREARRAAVSLLGQASAASRARRGASGSSTGLSQRQAQAQNVSNARSFLWGALDPGDYANRYQRSMRARAVIEFNRRVVGGEDPMTVAESLIEPFARHIQRGVGSRGGSQTRASPLPNEGAPAPGAYTWSPE